MTALFILDVPENTGMIDVAAAAPTNRIDRIGPYVRVTADEQITIDRRATGARHAVWYSSVAGLARARIVQHDKDALRLVRR